MKRYTIDEIYTRKRRMQIYSKVIMVIAYMMVIPLLIYNVVILYQAITSSDSTPSFLGYKTFTVISSDMIPQFNTGDIVVVKEKEQVEINQGDIISFREGSAVITHRVAEVIKEDGTIKYKTKGDANDKEDLNLVSAENIEGEYCFIIPKLGTFVMFIQNKLGIIMLAILIYIIFMCYKNKNKRKQIRKEKREIYEKIKEK